MNTFQAIIIAIIEGITEFLPVSSTGHMIIASSFFGIDMMNLPNFLQLSSNWEPSFSGSFIF